MSVTSCPQTLLTGAWSPGIASRHLPCSPTQAARATSPGSTRVRFRVTEVHQPSLASAEGAHRVTKTHSITQLGQSGPAGVPVTVNPQAGTSDQEHPFFNLHVSM